MKRLGIACTAIMVVLLLSSLATAQDRPTYLGMDRNDYPGDQNMSTLHKIFAFTGYWLNNPPGANANTWTRKRAVLESQGYGFLLLFNGREYQELKASGDAAGVGARDAKVAVQAAEREDFPKHSIIFLDQEQGGRMLPEQRAYIHAWVDAVVRGGYRAGIYCSGISVQESKNVSVNTANDIRNNAEGREIHFFISNDQCPPSQGCIFLPETPLPGASGVPFAEVWQYAQSPRRPEMTAACRRTYAADGNCYPPSVTLSIGLHVDLDAADSPDPSHSRTR